MRWFNFDVYDEWNVANYKDVYDEWNVANYNFDF
jgi:hypothetical protein